MEKNAAQSHFDKYEAMAEHVGIEFIKKMVLNRVGPAKMIKACVKLDPNLNNIPLRRWDNLAFGLTNRICKYNKETKGTFSWSLCEVVCVAKHVAKHHIANMERP